ncbi:MAG TPA: hypothetical protein VFI42_21345, partial [Thermomicrobiaceae bacterium]|nr:hypothetical protein [Thermomicrobiaceae bacterium]
LIEHPDEWPEANHQAVTWEWPGTMVRLERLAQRRAAGQFSPSHARAFDAIVRRLRPLFSALESQGFVIPNDLIPR